MPHIYLSVSGHGFGHFAQVAPLANALAGRLPDLEITLQSDLPEAFVRRRLQRFDRWHREIADAGMVMRNALDVDSAASLDAYRELMQHKEQHIARQIERFEECRPDLLIVDVPFIPLLAAQQMGIPNVAVCSLNWADILERYCGDQERGRQIVESLRQVYRAADLFVRTEPCLPMKWLPNGRTVGPIIEGGRERRRELCDRLGVSEDTILVMINLGGIEYGIDFSSWSPPPGQTWLVPTDWAAGNAALTDYWSPRMPFSDVFASVDAVVAKPGYGTFTEAALQGIPVLTVERGDWPEEPVFDHWMRQRLPFEVLSRERFDSGDFGAELARLVARGRGERTPASGINSALGLVVEHLNMSLATQAQSKRLR